MRKIILGVLAGMYFAVSLTLVPFTSQWAAGQMLYYSFKASGPEFAVVVNQFDKLVTEAEAVVAQYRDPANVAKMQALVERAKAVRNEAEEISKRVAPARDAFALVREKAVAAEKLIAGLEKDSNGDVSKQIDDIAAKVPLLNQRSEAVVAKQSKLEGLRTSFDEISIRLGPLTDKDAGTLALVKKVREQADKSGDALKTVENGLSGVSGNLSEQIGKSESALVEQKKRVKDLQDLGERLQTLAVQYNIPPKQPAASGIVSGKF